MQKTCSSNNLRPNAEQVRLTIMDPHATPNGLASPYLRRSPNCKHSPGKPDQSPKARVFQPQTLSEVNDMVLDHNDGGLANEERKR